ncbi:MAG: hypothetical protein ABFS42_03050 [Candidatus Krumholzibacteriota bacterium]
MATKNSPAKQSFYEVVFMGKPKVVRAFMKGFVMGTLDDATVIYSFNSGVHHEGKAEKLAEMVGIRGTDCHVIVDAATSALLKKRTKRITRETGLEITSHRHIRSASMFFNFHAYAPRYNQEIVSMVKKLPAGLRLEGFQHEVKLDPKAKGIEAYAAVHHYEACGEATVVGRIDLLVALKKKFADFPLIQSEDIVLKLA